MSAYPVYPAKSARPAEKNFLQMLSSIQLGGSSQKIKIKKRDLIFILRNIATLTENGLSLPKALETICKEKSLKKYSGMLGDIRQTVENGETFSGALLKYKDSFGELFISQIKIGEKSGTLPATLERLTQQLEHADNLKSTVIKKLSYPVLLCVAGTGAITFMIMYVVPTFEKTYKESGAKLPAVTQFLIDVGHVAKYYGWMIVLAMIVSVVAWVIARRTPSSRLVIDRYLLKVPMVGDCLRNFAVLQFMEVLGNLMEAGFTMVDALQSCAKAINNRAVRQSVEELHSAVLRGERFSSELEKHGDLFPPIVNQLIIVGEKTGTLGKATQNIKSHLKREVERYLSIMIGSIEPIMTAGLAAAIGTILLAIYLPMFDMIGNMK
ncbi:MAG: type II secretion system F family protein [Pirellulaceae bacterium]|nr:type II secretion system F family protein [Pirellulaceae bacterium]